VAKQQCYAPVGSNACFSLDPCWHRRHPECPSSSNERPPGKFPFWTDVAGYAQASARPPTATDPLPRVQPSHAEPANPPKSVTRNRGWRRRNSTLKRKQTPRRFVPEYSVLLSVGRRLSGRVCSPRAKRSGLRRLRRREQCSHRSMIYEPPHDSARD
jgi:hypothetical protein